ncbi:2-hydroxy-3-oxopropionate reductase [Paraburkholderia phenoliruptrix]|uniref:2-hydroxy-3-oxopropionate reductase n=3 Tax=Paraburkholderia phenoliruptrix TaxID=252970 RepID=K0DNT1_9BURK|nr:NAD(P)-dependent oxidoreductase [Paraburkholderia phenoliruptrix]AFT85553.1 2-hydroxy-3-oxopropionate reductase [Paraburkholderia phenoliruptrix BR3459a]MDR6421654.1 2-hydroxy-3-oxopropionate reductase [Paraburkholderia phenoliruptrix]CAB4048069.1 2-hydroxy-3-oxopropionate reductase [Paraburkholderia phenoliruptrix]
MEIGFCGPGLMGAPMIRHLLRAGHTVHVWNRTRAKAEALAAHGAKVVDTPRELAGRCDAVLLCLADAAAVEQTVFGPAGLLDAGGDPAPRRVRWIVDHSSIPPAATRALARRAAELTGETSGEMSGEPAGESALRAGAGAAPEAGAALAATGREAAVSAAPASSASSAAPADTPATAPIGWIDAPVSGGVAGAQAGTLAVMAGGATADVEAVRPLLAAYAARVTHMGDIGAGQTAKLCNQTIVTATIAAIAEAVSLAARSGIDAARLPEALAGGWADSVLLQSFVPRMTQGGFAPIGALRTFQKDIDTVAATAYETGTPMPVASTVQQLLRLGAAMGLGEADFSAFIDILQTPRGDARQ